MKQIAKKFLAFLLAVCFMLMSAIVALPLSISAAEAAKCATQADVVAPIEADSAASIKLTDHVSANSTIASFAETFDGNGYTVTFVDYNGNILKTETVPAGGSATPPADPTREGYDFVNWDGAYTSVYADTTVTAVYAIKTYTVYFWADGQCIATDTVEHGGTAVCPITPAKEGHTFTGWNASLTNITDDTDIIARFTANTYTVTFKDYDGTVFSTQTVKHGAAAIFPPNPTREGYTFAGWHSYGSRITCVTGNTTVTAVYAINKYTVTFKGQDGTTLKTETVEHGKAATAPTAPAVEGYTFSKWDTDFSKVTGNLTVTATYTKNEASADFFTFASGADTTYVSIDETNGYLVFKAGGLTAAEVIALFADTNVSITKANGTTAVTGTTKVGTTCIITSTINGVSKSITVDVIGDINGDGDVNNIDFSVANAHVKKDHLTDSAKIFAINVNSDENTNVIDTSLINAFAKGKKTHF